MALHIWRLITLAQLSYKLACTLFHFRIHTVLLLCRGNIWFYQPSVHSLQKAFTHIFFLGLPVRLWSGKQKTYTLTTTSHETSNPSTRAQRCSRLRKMWRRITYPTSEITAGKRDRPVSISCPTIFVPFFIQLQIVSSCIGFFFPLCHPETDLLYAAKVYRDDRMRKKAELMTMDNCRELDRLNNLFRGG